MLASRRSSLAKITGLLLLGALSLPAYGCGSSNDNSGGGSASCATKPSDCKPGTTCWYNTDGKYTCLPAKQGAGQGASCTNVVGQPQCDEGLGCFPNGAGTATGTCMPFCDNGGCGTDEGCFQVSLQNTSAPAIPICGPLPKDAGGNDSGTPQDSGSDATTNNDAATEAGSDATTNNDAATEAGSDATTNNDAGASDAAAD
jgi:hypothetical protein